MKMLPGFQRNRRKKGFLAASSLLLLLATQTSAQSGRRAPKPAQPPVTPQTDTDTTPKSSARELKQRVTLLVGWEPSSKHLLSEDAIFATFLQQLNEFKNVTATSIGDIKRDHAVKRAKSETETIVVLMQFDVDEFQSGTIILNAQDLDISVLSSNRAPGKRSLKVRCITRQSVARC